MVSGWFKCITFIVYFISIIIIHQLRLRSSGFRSQRLGTPASHDLSSPLPNLLGLLSVVQHSLQGTALYPGPSGSPSLFSAEQIHPSASTRLPILCPSATPGDNGLTPHLEMAPQADYPVEEMRNGLLIPPYKIKIHAKHASTGKFQCLLQKTLLRFSALSRESDLSLNLPC